MGARPLLFLEDEEAHWRSVENLPRSKLGHVSRSEWAALDAADAYIFLPGPADIDRYRRNMTKMQAAFGYNEAWYRRARRAGIRGARILLGYVSPERAASYGFDFSAWRHMVLEAGSADFRPMARKGRKIAERLRSRDAVTVSAPNGTRLTFRLRGRRSHVEDGIVDAQDVERGDFMTNVPPGYAYVAPDEASAEGTLVADLPTPYLGTLVRGLRVTFRDGRATWSAESGGESLRAAWDRANGPKDRLGFLGIGINPAARTGFLQDNLVAGVVEIGIGGNEEVGGRNRTSFYLGARLSTATVQVAEDVLVKEGRLAI